MLTGPNCKKGVLTRSNATKVTSAASGSTFQTTTAPVPNACKLPHSSPDGSTSCPITTTPVNILEESDSDSDLEPSDTKHIRGVCRGLNLDKIVKQSGKIKIKFKPGERTTAFNDNYFAEGIGVAIRSCAELVGVSTWKQVSETNKRSCRNRLKQWFDIEDLQTQRVLDIIDEDFKKSYKHWRNTLSTCHKKLLKEKLNPREQSPRPEVPLQTWVRVCDWLESKTFKKKSKTNSENKQKLKFPHTSGKQRYWSRLKKMDIPDKVQLFADTHVTKTGEFVNPNAKEKHDKMRELQTKPVGEGEEVMSEDDILLTTLGYKAGYQKGMGYGVVAPCRKKPRYDTEHDSERDIKLDRAYEKIDTLSTQLGEQTEINKSYEDKFAALQAEMRQMAEMMKRMQGTGTSSN